MVMFVAVECWLVANVTDGTLGDMTIDADAGKGDKFVYTGLLVLQGGTKIEDAELDGN